MLHTQSCEVTSNNLCVSGVEKRAKARSGDVLSLEVLLLGDRTTASGEMGAIQKWSRTARIHLHFPPSDSGSPALWMHCPLQRIWEFEKETPIQILLKIPLFLLR